MQKFSEWLDENSVGWANPSINDPVANYTGDARMSAIQRHITQSMHDMPGHDPVQGMYNTAANAGNPQIGSDDESSDDPTNLIPKRSIYKRAGDPAYHRGANQPLSWEMLRKIRQWGFGNADQFFKWWGNGGREAVTQMRDQYRQQYRQQYPQQ